MSLEFSNLPLAEVVVRIVFAEPLQLSFESYAEVWNRLRGSFDGVTDLAGIELPPNRQVMVPSHGTVGINLARGGIAVALQNDLITAKWNRSSGRAYPRYSALRKALWQLYDTVLDIVGGTKTRISIVNMSYVNLIFGGNDLPILVKQYLRPEVFPSIDNSGGVNDIDYSWRVPPATDFRINLGRTFASYPVIDPSVKIVERLVFALVTVCGTQLKENEEPRLALDGIHDNLQDLFLKVASEKALEEWGYVASS